MMRLFKAKGKSAIEVDEKELAELMKAEGVEAAPAPVADPYTKDELYAMSKSEQLALFKKLGVEAPRLEKDRVEMLIANGAAK